MTQSEQHYNKMTRTPVGRLITTLSIPAIISMLITNIYNLADTYFVGSIGVSASGAVGIVFTLMSILQAIAFMLGQGSGSVISRLLAQKDVEKAYHYASTGFFLAIILGLHFTLIGIPLAKPTISPTRIPLSLGVFSACTAGFSPSKAVCESFVFKTGSPADV